MKLNPEDLSVTSFRTSESAAIARPTTIGPYDPTAMTYCYYCPPQTINCPIGTDPITVIGLA